MASDKDSNNDRPAEEQESGNTQETESKENNNNENGAGDAQQREEQQLLSELERAKNDYLYLRAEFDNYRKHVIKERSELLRYGAERLIVALLEVVDNFERALELETSADNLDSFKKGMEMIAVELKNVLERFGVSPVDTQGQAFDPTIAEALSQEETDQVPEGHVARVFRKAYKLHDKIIRPAQVVVAKPPTKPAQ